MEVFDEASCFLIGPTFLREPSRKYSSNYDEGIYGVQKASLNMFWEHSGYSTIIFSGWLRAKGSPVAEEEGKKKEKRGGGGGGEMDEVDISVASDEMEFF